MESVNLFHQQCLSPCWLPSVRDAEEEVLTSRSVAKVTPRVLSILAPSLMSNKVRQPSEPGSPALWLEQPCEGGKAPRASLWDVKRALPCAGLSQLTMWCRCEMVESNTDCPLDSQMPVWPLSVCLSQGEGVKRNGNCLFGSCDFFGVRSPRLCPPGPMTLPVSEQVHNHFRRYEVEYLQFAFRWMNNLLMRELPLRCTIRLWDTYQVRREPPPAPRQAGPKHPAPCLVRSMAAQKFPHLPPTSVFASASGLALCKIF